MDENICYREVADECKLGKTHPKPFSSLCWACPLGSLFGGGATGPGGCRQPSLLGGFMIDHRGGLVFFGATRSQTVSTQFK